MATLKKDSLKLSGVFLLLAILLAACSSSSNPAEPAESPDQAGSVEENVTQIEPTQAPSPTAEVEPTESVAPEEPTGVPEVEPTVTPDPIAEPEPTQTREPEPTIEYTEIIPVGSVADLTATEDIAGIEGQVEVIAPNQIRIKNFVSLVSAAPGVDIRLGQQRDFSDDTAVVLKNITGKDYEGRSLTLTIPDEAFDGRSFDSISVICYETGEIFDWAIFEKE